MSLFIALELLFSEKTSTADKVCGRTAIFIHKKINEPFEKVFKKLQGLYDARSKFVHGGISISREFAIETELIIKQVLRNLLYLNLKVQAKNADFFEKWIKQLDWVKASYEAGQLVSESTYEENGII